MMLDIVRMKRLQELQTKVVARCLSGLSCGELDVGEYLKRMRAEERTEAFYARTFETFEEFEAYMRSRYPAAAKAQISHERLHFDCAVKHGLRDTRVGVYECLDGGDIMVNGVTLCYFGGNFDGWTAEEILAFERENYTMGIRDESASDSDKTIAEILGINRAPNG